MREGAAELKRHEGSRRENEEGWKNRGSTHVGLFKLNTHYLD